MLTRQRLCLFAAIWFPALLVVTFDAPDRAVAATPIGMLPNQRCAPALPGTIDVCGGTLRRDDVIRLHNLADCLVSRQRKASRAALLTYIRSGDMMPFQAIYASDNYCHSDEGLRVSPILLSGAFAEALLGHLLSSKQSLAIQLQMATAPKADRATACLMSSGRVEAMRLIKSPLYSRKEQAALGAVTARLRTCLPVGTEVRTNLAGFRAFIAINLFALAPRLGSDALPAPREPAAQPLTVLRSTVQVAPAKPMPLLTISFGKKSASSTTGAMDQIGNDPAGSVSDAEDREEESTQHVGPETGEPIFLRPDHEDRHHTDPY